VTSSQSVRICCIHAATGSVLLQVNCDWFQQEDATIHMYIYIYIHTHHTYDICGCAGVFMFFCIWQLRITCFDVLFKPSPAGYINWTHVYTCLYIYIYLVYNWFEVLHTGTLIKYVCKYITNITTYEHRSKYVHIYIYPQIARSKAQGQARATRNHSTRNQRLQHSRLQGQTIIRQPFLI